VRGVPKSCRPDDVLVRLDGSDVPNVHMSNLGEDGLRQLNAFIPSGLRPGFIDVNVVVFSDISQAVRVELV